jgi:putative DNA primase/helicase
LLDETGAAYELATSTARNLMIEAALGEDPDRRKSALKFAINAENRGRIEAILALAQSRPGIATTSQEFDQDRWLLNVQNGTLHQKTGELREHRRGDVRH